MPLLAAMCQSITFLLLVMLFKKSAIALEKYQCDDKYLTHRNDTIILRIPKSGNEISCKWIISPAENIITVVRILEININNCNVANSCCLDISGQPLCNDNQDNPRVLSFRKNPVTITLKAFSPLVLNFEYSTRPFTECPQSDFQCQDKSNCFNSADICSDKIICKDYSHKRGCGKCYANSTTCGSNSDYCFALTQRCDGVLNCPKGEDEFDCSNNCHGIKCPTEQRCITQNQICDDIIDCRNGFDESNCTNIEVANSFHIIMTFLVCSMCSIFFICLVYRWMTTRRDINRILQNLPEFPLAPFQGPGDQDEDTINSSDILDADIRPGGDIYESYVANIKKKSMCTKAVQAGEGKFSHLDYENELIVLASLGVPTHMCVGFTVSEDSITSLTNSKESAKSGNYTRTSEGRTGSSIKIIYREDLEMIDEKKSSKRPTKSAPVASEHNRPIVVSRLHSTAEPISVSERLRQRYGSSPNLSVKRQMKKGSQSDSLIPSSSEQSAQSRQIMVRPYLDPLSDSSQWTDMEEVPVTNARLKSTSESYQQKRRICKRRVGFPYRNTKI